MPGFGRTDVSTVVHFDEVDFWMLRQFYVFNTCWGAGIRPDNIIGFKLTYDIVFRV